VSCEDYTHMVAVANCYVHRDMGRVWSTAEVSGCGLHKGICDSKGIHEGQNTIVI